MTLTKLSFACLLAAALCLTPYQQSLAVSEGVPSQWLPAVLNNGLGQIGNTAYNEPNRPKDIRTIAANFVNIFLGLLGTIFIVLMIAAGFMWMTAAGNSEKIEKAIKLMAAGAIGLLIVLASFAISLYVTSRTIYSTTQGFLYPGVPQNPDPTIKSNNNTLY